MSGSITGQTRVAGVVGMPVHHSLSPAIHNAWLRAADIDAVYVAFPATLETFGPFVNGLRGGMILGLNVTAPFKERALALADHRSPQAVAAGAANLLLFNPDGSIAADNTDGEGLLYAFQTEITGFDPAAGPAAILGAGGAARGAAAAFLEAGAPQVIFLNRSREKAEALVGLFGERTQALGLDDAMGVLSGASVIINATPLGLNGASAHNLSLERAGTDCVVMDMVYRPILTALLEEARARGLRTVDGLWMLIGQAIPSFIALFGRPPPPIDIRSLALASVEDNH